MLKSIFYPLSKTLLAVTFIIAVLLNGTLPAQAANLDELSSTLKQLQVTFNRLAQTQKPAVLAATITTVSTPAELTAALNNATGGETILLNAGSYGALNITRRNFTAPVTIKSANATNRASFSSGRVILSSNVTLDSLIFDYIFKPTDSSVNKFIEFGGNSNIVISNSLFDGDNASNLGPNFDGLGYGFALWINTTSNLVIENNEFNKFGSAILVKESQNVKILENNIHTIRKDGMNIIQVNNILIEKNNIHDFTGLPDWTDHRDMIQFWTTGTNAPSTDVIIRNNILNINKGSHTQTIFIRNEEVDTGRAGDEMFYKNFLIENNTITNHHTHGITVGEIDGLVIRNNTINAAVLDTSKLSTQYLINKYGTNAAIFVPKINVASKARNVSLQGNTFTGGTYYTGARITPSPAPASWSITTTPTPTPVTPTLTLNTSASSVRSGSNATLTWSSTNATSCTASGAWTGSKSTGGSQSTSALSIVGTQTYTLACTGTGGTVTKSVSIVVISGTVITPNPTPSVSIPKNTTWQWQLTGTVDQSVDAKLYDIDLFDTSESVIRSLKDKGKIVICYFSAGSYENWRSDEKLFPVSTLGKSNGWTGEKWLDIRQIALLSPIMTARMDLAKAKGCDGLEPDNVDGYTNSTGFALTAADQIAFNTFLATEAHKRGLLIGLKNDVDQTTALEPFFDFAVNEQCFQYGECNTYQPFLKAGKAIFNVEYSLDISKFCSQANTLGIMSIKKNLNLDAFGTPCWTTAPTTIPTDTDRDTVIDTIDNCVIVANQNQANFDGDTQGDACDMDDDNDTILDAAEKTGCTLNVSAACGATTTSPVVVSSFKIGDRIEVIKNVNVRTSGLLAATTFIGTNPQGNQGTLVAGPTATDDQYGKLTWFNVNFDSGLDGWVGADNFKLVTTPTPTPTGARITVTDNVNVRSTANGIVLGTQYKGAQGTQATTPAVAAGGYSWIKVDFDSGVDGYVATSYLTTSTIQTTNVQTQINSLLAQLAQLQALLLQLLKAGV